MNFLCKIKRALKFQVSTKSSLHDLQNGADFIDMVLLNLEAGLSVEKAFSQTTLNLDSNPLTDSCQKLLSLCQVGFSFKEAIEQTISHQDISLIFKDILEKIHLSLKLGAPLVQILNHLSLHFRLIAFARLEEIASEAPVKMIFPLVLFIFPVIFILLGAGALESLVKSFNF